ncbi:hypothetical protein BDP27DRAFT_1370314 [Rhodocollybia butyracea]|uniref:Uncharacterized protein n=1 Tax=Rhodocollybia butyracea TaxID=206335 RepID=A0A9P5PC29_9AGAR|nr:hypothetical protein BDP27DRAFT_1370314 [Rhodocollybia butyracea]
MFCVSFYVLVLFVAITSCRRSKRWLSTTYVYELLNVQATVTFPEIMPTTKSISRTVVASASGWVELFDSGNLECRFINSDSGECFDENFTGTGVPIPVVLTVLAMSTSMPAEPMSSNHQSSQVPFLTAVPDTTSQSSQIGSQIGAIVGSTIAGLVSVCNVTVLILWLRRRRKRTNPCQGLDCENCDASQESSTRQLQTKLLVFISGEGGNVHPICVEIGLLNKSNHIQKNPVQSIQDAISTQTENGTIINSMQPRSKRAQANPFAKGSQALPRPSQMTVAVDQSIKRRSEEFSSVSDPPPSYKS